MVPSCHIHIFHPEIYNNLHVSAESPHMVHTFSPSNHQSTSAHHSGRVPGPLRGSRAAGDLRVAGLQRSAGAGAAVQGIRVHGANALAGAMEVCRGGKCHGEMVDFPASHVGLLEGVGIQVEDKEVGIKPTIRGRMSFRQAADGLIIAQVHGKLKT